MADFTEFPISTKAFDPTNFAGADGREVEFTKSATHVQWRYVGETLWVDLIALSELAGTNGPAIELQTSTTHIQWRVAGDTTWIDLKALSELQGPKGEDAVLPANNVTGTGVTHIWAGPDGTIPAEQDDDTIYFEFTTP